MTQTYFPKGFYGAPKSAPKKSGCGSLLGKIALGPVHFVNHLGSDVKDAVIGLPTGTVSLVEHPIRGIEQMGKSTWHDWSPLFEGHPGKFLKQTYDHPLAPLLDVATVFSLGAGAAAQAGKFATDAGLVGEATTAGRVAKAAADLGKSSSRVVHDVNAAKEGRLPGLGYKKTYGGNAGANLRRLATNKMLASMEPVLPKWFSSAARDGRLYAKLQRSDVAHRVAATNLQIDTILQAAHSVSDPSLAHIVQPELLAKNYWSFRTNAHEWDISKPLPDNLLPVREITEQNKDSIFGVQHDAAGNVIPLDKRMNPKSWTKDFTTRDLKEAAIAPGSGGKRILVVRKQFINEMGTEAENSTKLLLKLAHDPVKYWKRINVGYAPRVVTNNAVGNWLMFAMRTLGAGGARGFLYAIKHAHGERDAMKAFTEMRDEIERTQGRDAAAKFTVMAHPSLGDPNAFGIEKAFGKRAAQAVEHPPNWATKYFKDELGNVFGRVLEADSKPGRLHKAVQQGFYPLVHRFADEPVRVASLYQFLRKSPEVRAYLKTHPGAKMDDAIDAVLQRNPGNLRQRAGEHVRSIAGDYTTLGPAEKLVQNVVPFYLWDKHIAKHFGNMVSERPGTVATMQQVSLMGDKESNQLLGELPNFMQGALPLELFGLHSKDGRTPLLMTSGLNPYHTIGELSDFATALTTRHDATSGADAASQLSPILTGLVEQISGHKIGTDAPPAAHGGVLPSVVANTALGTSYGTLLQRLLGGTPAPSTNQSEPFSMPNPKPFLYSKTPTETLEGLFGLPVKEASLVRAHQMADQERGKKKTRKGAFGGSRRKGAF